jgi:subtilase family serine protease
VVGTHPNRTIVDVSAPVSSIEKAFNVKMHVYQHPTEARTFYAPDVEPTIPSTLPISGIGGLDNYQIPHPNSVVKPLSSTPAGRVTPDGGSQPGGSYIGYDFRNAYVPNAYIWSGIPLDGSGQSVALIEFAGYYTNDIQMYFTNANALDGFPIPNLTNVLVNVPIDGGISQPGLFNNEVALDIDMALDMAPGLSHVYIYELHYGFDDMEALNTIATDTTNWANQISFSWSGLSGDPASIEPILQEMAAQGQSFFCASGDNGAAPPGSLTTRTKVQMLPPLAEQRCRRADRVDHGHQRQFGMEVPAAAVTILASHGGNRVLAWRTTEGQRRCGIIQTLPSLLQILLFIITMAR